MEGRISCLEVFCPPNLGIDLLSLFHRAELAGLNDYEEQALYVAQIVQKTISDIRVKKQATYADRCLRGPQTAEIEMLEVD
ncbi:hypothetical protein ACFL2V_17645 [Pseudomonadota bacterium]